MLNNFVITNNWDAPITESQANIDDFGSENIFKSEQINLNQKNIAQI